jgi:hypothetical protein
MGIAAADMVAAAVEIMRARAARAAGEAWGAAGTVGAVVAVEAAVAAAVDVEGAAVGGAKQFDEEKTNENENNSYDFVETFPDCGCNR